MLFIFQLQKGNSLGLNEVDKVKVSAAQVVNMDAVVSSVNLIAF